MNSLQGITKRMKKFKYCSPNRLEEAVSLLEEYKGMAKLLAGGTDLLTSMKRWVITPEYIINLKDISGLDYIREEGDKINIGALTTISKIGASDLIKRKCLSLYEATKTFGTVSLRNMATIGGNICRSSSASDMVPPLMTFDAELKLVGPSGERKVLLEDFFTGAGENVLDNEILTEIVIPLREGQYGMAFEKLTRNSSDLAKVNCAIKIIASGSICDEIRIVLGAVADKPVRAKKAEQVIKSEVINDEVIESAARKVIEDIAPITDVRSTARYRTQVSKVLVKRLIKRAIKRTVDT